MTHDEPLPLEGYDHMSIGTVSQAIRSLDEDQLHRLLEYEEAHADRPLVKEILTTRMEELEAGEEPTEGPPPSGTPTGGSADSGSVRADTQAEPIIPPAHGVPATHKPRLGPNR